MAEKLEPQVELDYSDTWNNHTNRVRGGKTSGFGIDIKRGLSSEANTPEPSTCNFTVNNQDGLFSPRNPRSPLFGLIGRNTPVRVRIGQPHPGAANFDLTDTTAHVAPSVDNPVDSGMLITSWAAPEGGQSYTVPGSMTASNTIGGSSGTMWSAYEVINSSGPTGTRTATFSASEDYVAASVLLHGPNPAWEVGDNAVQAAATLRSAQLDVEAGWWVVFFTYFTWDNPNTPIPTYPVATQGGWMLVADTGTLQPGDSQTTFFRMKAWVIQAKTDTTLAIRPTVGTDDDLTAWGIALAFSGIDDFQFRFHGAISEWPQRWGQFGQEVWVPIEASGLTRRIGRTDTTIRNTVERFVRLNSTPLVGDRQDWAVIGYWPITDEQGSFKARAREVPNQPAEQPDLKSVDRNPPEYGRSELDVHLPNGARTSTEVSGILQSNIEGTNTSSQFSNNGGWAADLLYRTENPADWGDSQPEQFTLEVETFNDTGTFEITWRLLINPAAGIFDLRLLEGGVLQNSASFPIEDTNILNGMMHHLRIKATDGGAEIKNFAFFLDGVELISFDTSLAPPYTPDPSLIRIQWDVPNSTNDIPIRFGQLVLWGRSSPSVEKTVEAAFGYRQETPGERLERISREEEIEFSLIDTAPLRDTDPSEIRLGPQYDEKLIDVYEETAETGSGILYEPREFHGYAYRSVASLYDQPTTLPLDYEGCELNYPLDPTDDDRFIANDVTVNRRDGGESRAVQTEGPLNVNKPEDDPNGVGRYDTSFTVNVNADISTKNQATWRLHLGTVDKERYPVVNIRNLIPPDCPTDPDLSVRGPLLDIGDKSTISNLPDWMPPDMVEALLRGHTEHLDWYEWHLQADTVPEEPYHIGIIGQDRYSPLDSTTTADFDSGTETALTVQDNTGDNDLWSTTTSFPFDIKVSGVVLRVTGISGSSSPQTITVQQIPVNFIVKTIPAGSKVELARPVYRGI